MAYKIRKRRVYNILKLKSILKPITKETTRALKIMIVGFILAIAILTIKYKTVYAVKIEGETIGYVNDQTELQNLINEKIINKQGQNIESITLNKEPEYEKNLITRNTQTNEEEIIAKLEENTTTTYKFYAVTLNNKTKAYVDTIEQAEKVVEQIKKEYKGKGLSLDLAINEKYTEKQEEVKVETVKVAETSMEEEINKLLKDKEEKDAAKNAIATVNGINLSVLPVSGTISSRFGVSSSIRSGAHTGLDIACSKGTDIRVVAKGKVTFAGYKGAYGNLVKVDHGNGIETWYAHCSKIYVKEGQKVESGKVIAAVGSTGNSTGPHLHLEIRIGGTAVNPQKYLYK